MPEFIPTAELPDDLDEFTRAYLEAAEWTEEEQIREGTDPDSFEFEFSPEAIESARADCAAFQNENAADLAAYHAAGRDTAHAGHDFWLTRNHHGAGFWDRGLGDLGNRLTDAAHAYGSSDAYVGDDGLVYLS